MALVNCLLFGSGSPRGSKGTRLICRRIPPYCHIVLITSLFWLFIDALVLFYINSTNNPELVADTNNNKQAIPELGAPAVVQLAKKSVSEKGDGEGGNQVVPVPNPKFGTISK